MVKNWVRRVKGFTLIELMIVVAIIAIIAAIAIPSLLRARISANESSAVGTLRTIVTSQSTWRQNDTDRNTLNDYWVADVSGMYRVESLPVGSGVGVAVLDVAVAQADDAKLPGAPAGAAIPGTTAISANVIALVRTAAKSGYFYQAMTKDVAGVAYPTDPDGDGNSWTNTGVFAFQGRPEVYNSTGVNTVITDTAGVIYGKDFGNNIVANATQWPNANPASAGWRVVQ